MAINFLIPEAIQVSVDMFHMRALSGWLRRLMAHSSTTSGVCTLRVEGGRVACPGASGGLLGAAADAGSVLPSWVQP